MATKKKALQAAAGNAGGELQAIEDVFSTYLYTGTSADRSINNGIDLSTEGGAVWFKGRSSAYNHILYDTERGALDVLRPNLTDASSQLFGTNGLTAFNTDGFSITGGNGELNYSGQTYASWSFRKAPRFFDCVTYTGNSVAGRTVSHNLGVEPGCIIVKAVSGTYATRAWQVYHRGLDATSPEDKYLVLNTTAAVGDATNFWNDTAPTSTEFTLGTWTGGNGTGTTYVAYLFAHDPLGPSGDGSDGLIACGSYTGNGNTSGTNEVNLGWEPQTLIIKNASSANDWIMTDVMMGIPTSPYGTYDRHILKPNTSDAEYASADYFNVTPTGFRLTTNNSQVNASGSTYIYIAIRRGPMRPPESGTEVFDADLSTQSSSAESHSLGYHDMAWYLTRVSSEHEATHRLRDDRIRFPGGATYAAYWDFSFDNNQGQYFSPYNTSWVNYFFKRAPNFLDILTYEGTGSNKSVNHNLAVTPEMIITRKIDGSSADGIVYHKDLGASSNLRFPQSNAIETGNSTYWNLAPNETVFYIGTASQTNDGGSDFITYLFATLPGVSKVGSYTGNGSSQTLDCGFTSGARFVLIKRTDSTGDWYVWDTARGIVTGNDPHLSLNSSDAEVTSDDTIDPDSSGFIVNQVSATNVNVSSASYIYLAIA